MRHKVILVISILLIISAGCSSNIKNNIKGVSILELKNEEKHLLFYGSRHSNDKSDPMFDDIKRKFEKINPEIVLVEGYFNNAQYSDADEAIKNGEVAYVSYLAQKNNIPVDTVEPSEEEQFKYLTDKYDNEKVLCMYLLRQLLQYQSQQASNPRSIKELLTHYLSVLEQKGFPLEKNQITFQYVQGLLKPYLKVELDQKNWIKCDVYSIVHNKGSVINDIYEEVYNKRNEHLLLTIEKYLKEHDRVFVIMGSKHVIDKKDEIANIFN